MNSSAHVTLRSLLSSLLWRFAEENFFQSRLHIIHLPMLSVFKQVKNKLFPRKVSSTPFCSAHDYTCTPWPLYPLQSLLGQTREEAQVSTETPWIWGERWMLRGGWPTFPAPCNKRPLFLANYHSEYITTPIASINQSQRKREGKLKTDSLHTPLLNGLFFPSSSTYCGVSCVPPDPILQTLRHACHRLIYRN